MPRTSRRLLLVAAIAVAGCSAEERPGDVLLLTVDTLRTDRVGLYGSRRPTTPALDRWFADGAVFERAYATTAYTSPSVVSLLSGLLPQEHRVRLLDQRVPASIRLLPELLPPPWQTAGFVSNAVLTDAAIGIGDRFDHWDEELDAGPDPRTPTERDARATTDAVLHWLREESDPGRPLFLWVHYMDPHWPYAPPGHAPRRFDHHGRVPLDPRHTRAVAREQGVEDALEFVDRYDEEVAYTDAEIGRLLDGYAALRSPDRTLFVFTADHGETLLEHASWFSHSYQVYEEIVRVPLLLRGPGVASGRRPGLVSGIDLAPTILAFAEIPVPEPMPRVDLRSPGGGPDRDRVVFAEALFFGRQWRAAIQRDAKWVVRLERGDREIAARRFYDLARDPLERHPGGWRESPASRRLRELVRSDPDPGGFPEDPERGEIFEALHALGYLSRP